MPADSPFTDPVSPTCRGRPSLTVHYAQTLDGRIATRGGHSQWISSEESLRLAHQLRAQHQAVMVGVGTVLSDNPRLTVRHVSGAAPRRIVVDSTLRLPLDSHVLGDQQAETIVATTARAPRDRVQAVQGAGAEVLTVKKNAAGRVDLEDLLDHLMRLGISSLLLEGGRELITAVLQDHLVDRLMVCIAPKLIGSGIEAVGDLAIRNMDDALTFAHASFTTLGEDIIFDGRLMPASVKSA